MKQPVRVGDCWQVLNLIMNRGISLISSVDPFVKYKGWERWTDESSSLRWVIRPFWIIEDLRIIYTWLNDVNGKTNNSALFSGRMLIQHYINRLKHEQEQSISIIRNDLLIGQFDLLPVAKDGIYMFYPVLSNGISIKYIIPSDRANTRNWVEGFVFLIRLIFRQYPGICIYLEVPFNHYQVQIELIAMGFTMVHQYRHGSGEVQLFVVDRSPFSPENIIY